MLELFTTTDKADADSFAAKGYAVHELRVPSAGNGAGADIFFALMSNDTQFTRIALVTGIRSLNPVLDWCEKSIGYRPACKELGGTGTIAFLLKDEADEMLLRLKWT